MEKRTGTTTRLADKYIQLLFKNNTVVIKDKYDNESVDNDYFDNRLFDIVRNRLETEHKGTKRFIFDRKTLTINIEKYEKQLR